VFFPNFSILLRLHSKMSTYRERTSRSPEISDAPRRGKRQLTEEPCLVTGFPQLPSAGSYLFASLWYDFISRRVRRLRAAWRPLDSGPVEAAQLNWGSALVVLSRRVAAHRCHSAVNSSHPTGIRSVLNDRDSVKRRTRSLCCSSRCTQLGIPLRGVAIANWDSVFVGSSSRSHLRYLRHLCWLTHLSHFRYLRYFRHLRHLRHLK
jgi:hypothetical protein